MKQGSLRPVAAILSGILVGVLLSLFFKQGLIITGFGALIGVKLSGVAEWRRAALCGALIGLVLGVSVGASNTVQGVIDPALRLSIGLGGAIAGAVCGVLACKVLHSDKGWMW